LRWVSDGTISRYVVEAPVGAGDSAVTGQAVRAYGVTLVALDTRGHGHYQTCGGGGSGEEGLVGVTVQAIYFSGRDMATVREENVGPRYGDANPRDLSITLAEGEQLVLLRMFAGF
jgi:hypothetical protein